MSTTHQDLIDFLQNQIEKFRPICNPRLGFQDQRFFEINAKEEWDNIKDDFLQGVYLFGAMSFDTESHLVTKQVLLAHAGNGDGIVVTFDLRSPKFKDFKTALPRDFIALLEDTNIRITGSDVLHDFVLFCMDQRSLSDRTWIDTRTHMYKLVSNGVLNTVNNRHGLDQLSIAIWKDTKYSFKPYTRKDYRRRYGPVPRDYQHWRSPTTLYDWQRPLTFYQRWYIHQDAVLPLAAIFTDVIATLKRNPQTIITNWTSEIVKFSIANVVNVAYNHDFFSGHFAPVIPMLTLPATIPIPEEEEEQELLPQAEGGQEEEETVLDREEDDETDLGIGEELDESLDETVLNRKRMISGSSSGFDQTSERSKKFRTVDVIKGTSAFVWSVPPVVKKIQRSINPKKLTNPPLDCCVRCGSEDHKWCDCHDEIDQCAYLYCTEWERPHTKRACRDLHRVCDLCRFRGHSSIVCPRPWTDPEIANCLKRDFEANADEGCYTRMRFTDPAWGFYFFKGDNFACEGINDGIRYTYHTLARVNAFVVQDWIDGWNHSVYA